MTVTEIEKRLDLLVKKMNGRTLRCKSWKATNNNTFEPDQVRGTFDDMLIHVKNHKIVMQYANDLWEEASK